MNFEEIYLLGVAITVCISIREIYYCGLTAKELIHYVAFLGLSWFSIICMVGLMLKINDTVLIRPKNKRGE